MRALALVVVCASLSVACAGAAAPTPEEPAAVETDPEEAAAQARAIAQEIYGALRRGKPGGLLPLLAEDLVVIGPGAGDVTDRAGALAALADAFDRDKHKVKSRGLAVVPARSGRSAWAIDTVEVDGTSYAVSMLVAMVDDVWVAVAVHVGATATDKRVAEAAAAGVIAAPAPVAPAPDPTFQPVMDLVLEGLAEPAAFVDHLGGDDPVVVGAAPKEITRGTKKIDKAWSRWVKKQTPTMAGRMARAIRAPGGDVVWVVAVVEVREDGGPVVPHRISWIYELLEGEDGDHGWSLRVMHASVPRLNDVPR